MNPFARGTALLLGVVAMLVTMAVPANAHAATQPGGSVLAAPAPGRLYQILNLGRGQCLAGRTNNKVSISGCEVTFTDQYWLIEPVATAGFVRLRGLATAKCLAIISNGNVRISTCVDAFADQWWRFDPTPVADSYMLFNHQRRNCLAAPRASSDATSFRCEPTFTDQWWNFIPR